MRTSNIHRRSVLQGLAALGSTGLLGSAQAQVYLGSPSSVPAAAVKGQFCDPRELLGDNP